MAVHFGRLIAVLSLGLFASTAFAHTITKYAVATLDCRENEANHLVRAFRTMHFDGLPRYLVVDAESFETSLIDPAYLDCEDPTSTTEVAASKFGRALRDSTAAPFPLRNDGVVHATHGVHGVFLTADLCPASREIFERRLFDLLEKVATKTGGPVPITLSVSGKWIRQHPVDFDTILQLGEMRKIDVTWMNHSDTHPYRKGSKDTDNFLLESGLNPDDEIEGVERELLMRGELPSPFFRFPGLVSNQKWIEALAHHSLIPVGADAWLALGEKPKSGSIILIHANGNEPQGVSMFLKQSPEIEAIGPFLPLSDLF
jgi:hypothetical protein